MSLPVDALSERRRTLGDILFEELLAEIESGELPPGAPLREEALERRSGMSRIPVREALDRLDLLGLVVVESNEKFVSPIVPGRLRDIAGIAGALFDGVAVDVLPLASDDERRRLADQVRAHSDGPLLLSDTVDAFTRLYGNRAVDELIIGLRTHLRRYANTVGDRALDALDADAVRDLADAVERGDARRVGALTRASLDRTDAAFAAQQHGEAEAPGDVRGIVSSARRPVHADVFSSIRSSIMDGRLKPGQRVPESSLIASLGVSRGPVRQALNRLARQRLVVLAPGRSPRIAPFDEPDNNRVLYCLLLVLARAVEIAVARLSDDDVAAVVDAHRVIGEASARGDAEALARAYFDHIAVFVGVLDGPVFVGVIDNLEPLIQRAATQAPDRLDISIVHEAFDVLTAAAQTRDAAAAARAFDSLRAHVVARFTSLFRGR